MLALIKEWHLDGAPDDVFAEMVAYGAEFGHTPLKGVSTCAYRDKAGKLIAYIQCTRLPILFPALKPGRSLTNAKIIKDFTNWEDKYAVGLPEDAPVAKHAEALGFAKWSNTVYIPRKVK